LGLTEATSNAAGDPSAACAPRFASASTRVSVIQRNPTRLLTQFHLALQIVSFQLQVELKRADSKVEAVALDFAVRNR
jgi:hypothetical protein